MSKPLVRMDHAYRRICHAAIIAVCIFYGPAVAARELCVLVPHLKDEYWVSVAYGIETRAREKGLAARFFEAGGYRSLAQQVQQLTTCGDADTILIGAVSSNDPVLLSAVSRAAERRPVIGLVNEIHSDALMARVGVDWTEMGITLGKHLASLFPAGSPRRQAVLLTGPKESGWVSPLETGLRHSLEGSALSIRTVFGADTGSAEQLRILERALAEEPAPDVIVGSAPAIEAAMALVSKASGGPLLVATYVSHSVARGLVNGRVEAAPFDDPVLQGRMAVDAALAAMDAHASPGLTGPPITLVTKGANPGTLNMSPADYFPVLD